jgi:hypothetical protein
MFPSIHSVALSALARHIRRDIGTVRTWHSLNGDPKAFPPASCAACSGLLAAKGPTSDGTPVDREITRERWVESEPGARG